MRKLLMPLFLFVSLFLILSCSAPNRTPQLTREKVLQDLEFLHTELQKRSSYQGLNGFDYKKALDTYKETLSGDTVSRSDFGLFLTETIGKIGDRHSSARKYPIVSTKYLPFSVAPLRDKVVALTYHESTQNYQLLYPNYPYLSAINGIAIHDFLAKINPEELKAPAQAYFTRAIEWLIFIERNYQMMGVEMPQKNTLTFSNETTDTSLVVQLQNSRKEHQIWVDKISSNTREGEELNDPLVANEHFILGEDNIAYIHIPDMVRDGKAPIFYEELDKFMQKAKSSRALIIDVRGNPGGRRDLIMKLGAYTTHPDSIYIVNIARQRAELPLNDDLKDDMEDRYLFNLDELDTKEQKAVEKFMTSFQPAYELPSDKFSEYHFTVFNGSKKQENEYHYKNPVYLLVNERSFSAATVFAAMFKGLPNVSLVGTTTDGSSGNSESFYLPHSNIRIKISTMVSFQKDGKLMDGVGTEADIRLGRSLEHILWNEDYQLNKLKEIIQDTEVK